MKDYSAMSDLQINIKVAVKQGFDRERCDLAWRGKPDVGVERDEITGNSTRSFNYCNNPADAWPIIFRERITLTPKVTGYEWDAISPVILNDDIEHLHTDKNPLRAAMIVYLKLVEGNADAE